MWSIKGKEIYFELAWVWVIWVRVHRVKMTEKWGEIQGKLRSVRVIRESSWVILRQIIVVLLYLYFNLLKTIIFGFNFVVESAYCIIVTWDAIHPKSGLDVTYLLFKGNMKLSRKWLTLCKIVSSIVFRIVSMSSDPKIVIMYAGSVAMVICPIWVKTRQTT